MHFKSVVILCALYLVTVTQSVGLNYKHLVQINTLFGDHKNGAYNISKDDIITMASHKDIRLTNISNFQYKADVTDARKVQDLLVFMANNDKKTDSVQRRSFTSYEVNIYVNLFRKKDEDDGLLDNSQIKEVINDLNLEQEVKETLAYQCEGVERINASQFLQHLLTNKEQGKGIYKNQVEGLIQLHHEHSINDYIDHNEIQEFFEHLSIVNGAHLLVFDYNQTAQFELQELLVVLADYNKVTYDGTSIPGHQVRKLVWDFARQDRKKAGVLGVKQLQNLLRARFFNTNASDIINEFDKDGDNGLNITEFFMAVFQEHKQYGTKAAN